MAQAGVAGQAGSATSGGKGGTNATGLGGAAGEDGSAAGGVDAEGGMGGAGGPSAARPVLVATVQRVDDMVVKDGYVYFDDNADDPKGIGHLGKVSVAGGTPTILVGPDGGSLGELAAFGIGVAGGSVYWIDSSYTVGANRLMKTPIEGGDSVQVWQGDPICVIRGSVAVDGDNVYWMADCSSTGMLMTVDATGGMPTTVASGDTDVWQAETNFNFKRMLAVGNGFATWTRLTGGIVSTLSLDDPSSAFERAEVSGPASNPVISGGQAFFISVAGGGALGGVYAVTPGTTFGGLTDLVPQQPITDYFGLAADEAFAYFALTDSIERVPLTGGDPITLVSSLVSPRTLAVDDTSIYWADDTGIWRATKAP